MSDLYIIEFQNDTERDIWLGFIGLNIGNKNDLGHTIMLADRLIKALQARTKGLPHD